MQQNQTDRYLELVKEVGLQLRALLTSVDSLVPYFPQSAHKQVYFYDTNSTVIKHIEYQKNVFYFRWKWLIKFLAKIWVS